MHRQIYILTLVGFFFTATAISQSPTQKAEDRIAAERLQQMIDDEEREVKDEYDRIKREERSQSSSVSADSANFVALVVSIAAFAGVFWFIGKMSGIID